ncbi:Uncharacterised protein [Mycobacterium tuberculosis]|nr:Uncharacterised protein [Mycobacterium tuberculosis]CNM58184.1 Uncharacterised protein [Mycobacterium tuberculosis]CNM61336.1 Uncharacterised protein [Mycobacterium tuberculosis]CNM67193.1 Uncharacterised protein [Mycobacterium tuberculosis]CNM75905.1 Uncharacterised protein [Mycobacterium tuberculosis]
MLPTVGFTPNKPIASGDAGIEIDPTLMTWNADSSRPIEFRVIGGMLMGPTSAPVLLMPSPMAGTVIGVTLIGPTNAPELLMPRPISGMVMDGMVMGPTEPRPLRSRPAAGMVSVPEKPIKPW